MGNNMKACGYESQPKKKKKIFFKQNKRKTSLRVNLFLFIINRGNLKT